MTPDPAEFDWFFLVVILVSLIGLGIWKRKYVVNALVISLSSWSFLAYWGSDQVWPPWAWLTFWSVPFIAYSVNQRRRTAFLLDSPVPISFIAMASWVALSAWVLVEFNPALEKPGMPIAQISLLKSLSSLSLFEFTMLSASFVLSFKKLRIPLAWVFYGMGLIHALSLLWDQLVDQIITGKAPIGLLGNRSIGASFAALWVFYALYFADVFLTGEVIEFIGIPHVKRWAKCSALVGVMAVLVSQSGISYLSLLFGALALGLTAKPKYWYLYFSAFPLGLAVATVIKPTFYAHVPRYDAWALFYAFWREHFLFPIGAGVGTFKFWGPAAQFMGDFQVGRWWLWAHSDWFQLLFEVGAVGLALALWCYATILHRAKARPALFASLVALGVVMVGNYPLHVAPFALFIWWISFEAVSV